MKLKVQRVRIPAIECPHCGARSIARSSDAITRLYREVRYLCDNDECGHSFVCSISVLRTVRPSAMPDPDINIPVAPPRRPYRRANDNEPVTLPPPANDSAMSNTG